MLTLFKLKCRHFIENEIDLPSKNFFVKNKNSIRLCYTYRTEIRYIYLASPQEVAEFLKKHGLIKMYSSKDDQVKMFIKKFDTVCGPKGEPVMKERLISLPWENINFTRCQIITFAGVHEWETNKELKKLFRKFFKAA